MVQRWKIIHCKHPIFLMGVAAHLGQPSKRGAAALWSASGAASSSLRSRDAQAGEESTQQLGHTNRHPWTRDLWIPVQNVTSQLNQEKLFPSGLCIQKYDAAYALFIEKGWHSNSAWVPATTLHLSDGFPIETDSCSGCLTLLSPFPLILRDLKSLESYSHANFVIHWNSPFALS